jgi:hypothetical protein
MINVLRVTLVDYAKLVTYIISEIKDIIHNQVNLNAGDVKSII